MTARILVIGGASLDTLHFAGQTASSAGGAGMYTAMAAHRSGAQVTLFAPRPDPVPEVLRPVAERLTWLGPVVPPSELPHFEIAYRGGETVYVEAYFGEETRMTPDSLPPDLSVYDCVHVIPMGSTLHQLEFLRECRRRGARRISAGTFPVAVADEPEAVRSAMGEADLFFLNEGEAKNLFGSVEAAGTRPGKLLFVTLGEKGAAVIQGEHVTRVPGVPADRLDPTGAGDTFCGAALAHAARGEHPAMAAHLASSLAAQMIGHVGPGALFRGGPPPGVHLDGRVLVDGAQVERVARLVASLPGVAPFDYTGPGFPPAGHPAAPEFFFASVLQQFGFWTTAGGKYHRPLVAPLDGVERKGSDYMFGACLRRIDDDPGHYTPARQAELTRDEMLSLLRADDGSDPMPAFELHLSLAREYGRDMLALGLTPRGLLERAIDSGAPLRALLDLLDHVGGYKEDPLRKKSGLLALVLNQRPESFLAFREGEDVPPVIDYHLMRSCLRVGLLEVVDGALAAKLAARELVSPAEEWAVRYAAYRAVGGVTAASGRGMGAVDWFFFNARRRCPEMTEPECGHCPVDPVCRHHRGLFQPVLRTTFY